MSKNVRFHWQINSKQVNQNIQKSSRLNTTCDLITACPFGFGVPVCAPCEAGWYRTSRDQVMSRCVQCRDGSYVLEGETHCQPCGPNKNTGGRPGTSVRDCGE